MRVSVIGSEYWSLYQYSRRPKIAPLRQAELTEWYDMRCYFNVRAQKLTSVYRTEPTTKKWRKEELKSKDRICSEVSVNSPENPWSQSWRKKGRLRWQKNCRKRLYMRMGVVKLQYSESYSQEFNKLFSGPKSTYFQNIKSIHNFLKETNGCGRGWNWNYASQIFGVYRGSNSKEGRWAPPPCLHSLQNTGNQWYP